jgi:hypothetical protein
MSLSAKLALALTIVQTKSQDFSATKDSVAKNYEISLLDGSGAGQATTAWHDQRTLSSSANEDLDLSGVLTDAFGDTITFTKIKAIVVSAASANAAAIEVGGAATNALVNFVGSATDKIKVRPGGLFVIASEDATAYAVTAGTGDLLRITNTSGAASATYDIFVIGVE